MLFYLLLFENVYIILPDPVLLWSIINMLVWSGLINKRWMDFHFHFYFHHVFCMNIIVKFNVTEVDNEAVVKILNVLRKVP